MLPYGRGRNSRDTEGQYVNIVLVVRSRCPVVTLPASRRHRGFVAAHMARSARVDGRRSLWGKRALPALPLPTVAAYADPAGRICQPCAGWALTISSRICASTTSRAVACCCGPAFPCAVNDRYRSRLP